MKTYKKDVDLFLVDGEVVLVGEKSKVEISDHIIKEGHFHRINTFHPDWVNDTYKDSQKILYSTKQLQGVKPLDRSKFIKPVNVESKAIEMFEKSNLNLSNDFILGFKSGYNANKNEYTREEAKALFDEGCRQGTGNYPLMSFYRCIEILNPLSLPQSITINDNDEIVEVVW